MSRKKKEKVKLSEPKSLTSSERIKFNRRLMERYHFDMVDLEANCEGNITNLQLTRLGQRWWNKCMSLIFGIPLFLCIAYISYASTSQEDLRNPLIYVCPPLLGLYAIAAVFDQLIKIVQVALDVRFHEVCRVTGKPKIDSGFLGDYLVIDGRRLPVAPEESGCFDAFLRSRHSAVPHMMAFPEKYYYTIYYVPHSKTILSAEISRPEDFEAQPQGMIVTMGADGEIELG